MKENKTEKPKKASMSNYFTNIEVILSFNIFKNKDSMFLKLILFFLLSIFTQKVAAQSTNATINIVNEYNKPIAGVNVSSITNPTKFGITDKDGNATLEIELNDYVKVSYNEIEKIVLINSTRLKIELLKASKKVNVGYATMKTTDAVTTAVDLVYSDKLQKSSLNNPLESLYGKLKGLMVLQNAGEPWNRDPTMFLRGVATTGNNRILTLVDGFERDISSLSLMDIESVAVLKDGTDVAKYGIRGANGVILVTTKRGESNSFHVDITYDKGINTPANKPNFLNSFGFANAVNQANLLDGNPLTYSAFDLNNFKNGDSPLTHPNVNWFDETLKDFGATTNVNTSFYGGGKSINYFVSLNYQNERGLLENTSLDNRYDSSLKYDRLNFRTNLDIALTESTKFIVDVSGYIGGQKQPSAGRDSEGRLRLTPFIMNAIYNIPSAAMPVRSASGEWGGTFNYGNNPVALASSTGIATLNYRTLFANGKIVQDLSKIAKGLSAEVSVAYDNFASIFENKTRNFLYEITPFTRTALGAIVVGAPIQQGSNNADLAYADGFGDQVRHATGIGKINYENKWDNNKITASFLYQEDKRVNDTQYNTFLRENYMTSASYAYKNRYFIDGVLAYSGTNVLPKENRFGFFPAVSAGWVINRENFLKDSKVIDHLKLRGSWGMSGNDILTQNLDLQAFASGGVYSFTTNNNAFAGIREGRLAAEGLTYEKSEKINVGLNVELFKKLTINLDVFQDKRTDIIVSTSGAVPTLIGIAPAFENVGEVVNRGIEGSFQYKDEVGTLKYFVSGNFTYAKNEIKNINEEPRAFDYLRQTGQSVGQRFGLESLGFFQNQADINASPKQLFSPVRPGDVKYKDQNNDGFINDFDEVAIGNSAATPELYYALNLGFEIDGFGVDMLLQGIANQTLYLNTRSVFWPLVGQNNISEFSSGAWTPETASTATLPRLTMLNNENNYRPNDIWLQSANYLKMRHFEFYYNFSENLLRHIKISRAKIYARGMNLFSIDDIKVTDPESIGIGYPLLASYHLGIKIEF